MSIEEFILIRSQQFRFIVKKGPNPGHSYPAFAEKITIGRDPMSDIIFKDPEVSRRHVQFTRDGSGYLIEDLGSTNGTFINGERLAGQQIRLKAGQEIALGGAITLIFEEQDKEQESTVTGTQHTSFTPDDDHIDVGTDELEDPYAEYRLDGVYDYDEEEEPQIDKLQSFSPLSSNKAFLYGQVQDSSKNPANSPILKENGRTFTNREIVYLIVGTVLATVIVCGILLLIFYFAVLN